MRRHLLFFASLFLLLVAPRAHAQGMFEFDLNLPQGDDEFAPGSEQDEREFFNQANCLCGSEFQIEYQLVGADEASLPETDVEIWFGTNCSDIDTQGEQCMLQESFPDLSEFVRIQRSEHTVTNLLAPLDGTCPTSDGTAQVHVLVDEEGDNMYEEPSGQFDIPYDNDSPPLPDDIEVRGGEGAISVTWDPPDADSGDLFQVQFLCANVDGSAALESASGSREYETAMTVCGMPSGVMVEPFDLARIDQGTESANELPAGLANLEERFLCGTADGSSVRIGGLDNGETYRVVMVAVDQAGNPAAIDLGVASPVPVVDFWEQYQNAGGGAEGCGAGGSSTLFGGLLVLAMLALFRRRRATFIALVFVLGVAAGGPATAQPYWDELQEDVPDEAGGPAVKWNFGIKLGTYIPNVDSEFSMDPGPFELVFGSRPGLMTQFELDRYFAWPLGQLGASASVGFMTREAKAFLADEDGQLIDNPDSDNPRHFLRSDGDKTTFRIIPVSLGAVYRFTELDDRYRVPLIPYGKLGLSYYIWRITAPSGDTAETPTASCPDLEGCDGNKALGGSWGWHGTVGLAVRLERIDPGAELSLRNELGIEHAGLYAELSYAKVDGFGSDSSLAVGDFTWFGGINFEF